MRMNSGTIWEYEKQKKEYYEAKRKPKKSCKNCIHYGVGEICECAEEGAEFGKDVEFKEEIIGAKCKYYDKGE